jgi:hypothetical protein
MKRVEPVRKRSKDILQDLLDGHAEADREGPETARRYLERVIASNHSLPNAVKFFTYDLLAEACARVGDDARLREAVGLALGYIAHAQEDADRAFAKYLPEIRCFERGIAAAVDDGDYDKAVELCDQAVALGLGDVYARKRASIDRWA